MKKKIISFCLTTFATSAIGSHDLLPIEVSTPHIEEDHQILSTTPGVSFQKSGGNANIPVIHGMADDRVNIKIDGAQMTSSCPNHMNPALSYVDQESVESMEVLAGLTPVSHGGDSLGGSVIVKTKKIQFKNAQNLKFKSFFKSNNENTGASVYYTVSSKKNFVSYEGMDEKANNYRNGNGKRLRSTLYNRNNQSLTIARKLHHGELSLKYMHTIVPYEGFINQWMDMENNVSNHLIGGYKGYFGKALLESSFYYQHTNHYMNIITSQRSGSMPMYTRSDEAGYDVKLLLPVDNDHLVTVGSDFNRYRIDDWWPPLPGVTNVMGPGTFESINNGKRDRLGLFVEADSKWSSDFTTNMGVRTDIVRMDTGDVQGYNDTDNLPDDANFFNSKSHKKTDNNYDFTLTSKTKLSSTTDFLFGVGRKSRSPNMYERFAWAGSVTDPTGMTLPSMGASMDMTMINWFGDGNGYVGNLNLKPEVAHKISSSLVVHDADEEKWEVKLSPYFSDIQNFVDADFIGTSMNRNFLHFANHDAVVFGADLSGQIKFQQTSVRAIANYTRGYRKDGKAELYHLMPLNGKIFIQHDLKKTSFELVSHLVNKKEQVNDLRKEPVTPGFALFDLGTTYRFTENSKFNFTVSNILDHQYALPLGGIDLVNYSSESRTPVSGMGRSYNFALVLSI